MEAYADIIFKNIYSIALAYNNLLCSIRGLEIIFVRFGCLKYLKNIDINN